MARATTNSARKRTTQPRKANEASFVPPSPMLATSSRPNRKRKKTNDTTERPTLQAKTAKTSKKPKGKIQENSNWTTAKSEKLRDLLIKEGFDGNYNDLAKKFPDQSSDSLRYFFHTLHQKNKTEPFQVRIHETYGKYIKAVRGDRDSQALVFTIPLMFKWFAAFEHHPDPAANGGVDYPSIYRCLACLMHGFVPPQLNTPSAAVLKRHLELFLDFVRNNMRHLPFPKTIQMPEAPSKPRTQGERNGTLAGRRFTKWNEEELEGKNIICNDDLHAVRQWYLRKPCFNPFQVPRDS